MKIGIVADIHEEVEHLAQALDQFVAMKVDTVVNLGDACDIYGSHSRAPEVAALLEQVGAVGVWGNHDFGLCQEVPGRVRERADPALLRYMATMRGRWELGACHFSHVEPWLDPFDLTQLWYFDGLPDTPEKASKSFNAVPHRYIFVGHFHRWWLMSPEGRVDWTGETAIRLSAWPRTLIAMGPVITGWAAVFDDETGELTPLRC